jgi:hypothetical protein
MDYDKQHWEQLINTIIERLGVESFIEHAAYVLEERGCVRLASELRGLTTRLVVDAQG